MTTMHARTSVIIPVHNGAKFAAEAIGSVLVQLDQADEVIVVDDASTDDTQAVVASLQHSRVRPLQGSGRGVSSARNIGLAAATGEFIAFLDHDDLWPPERHRILSSVLLDHPEFDAVNGRWRILFDGIEPVPAWQELDGYSSFLNSLSTALFRRRALDRIDGFDESMRFNEDVDYVLRLRETGIRMHSLEADTLIRRRHSTNTTLDFAAARNGAFEFLRRRIESQRARNTRAKS